MSEAYRKAGVDIAAGNEAVERIKGHVQRTFRPEVLTGLGGFGGLFAFNKDKYADPVLVSGTDGVGTKLKLAFALDKHDTIGIDAVAMCVNDIAVTGAEPLFFLDYIATGKIIPAKIEAIVKGVADGCAQAGCALIGGETAEMPDMYADGEYDIAGFAVGAVERNRIIDGATIAPGDAVIGLSSSGLHSNGFSLVRKVLLEDKGYRLDAQIAELGGRTLGETLLTPTKIYVNSIREMMKQVTVKGLAHITGGGFIENIPRILPDGVQVAIKRGSWDIPPVFQLLAREGNLTEDDLYRTFNMGIGMVAIVNAEDADRAVAAAREAGETAQVIGEVRAADNKRVVFCGG